MAIRSFFVLVKCALAVNRNMIASAHAAAFRHMRVARRPERRGS
jgi:hypothetical protein